LRSSGEAVKESCAAPSDAPTALNILAHGRALRAKAPDNIRAASAMEVNVEVEVTRRETRAQVRIVNRY